MHAPRIHFKEHMRTEKTRLQHQIWPQKRGQFLDLQFAPFPIEGWFWGPLVGPRNGPRNSAFFPLLLPYHLGLNILASMAAAATILCVPDRLHHQMVYLLKVSLHNRNHMRSTQLLRLQAYTHTQWGPTATKPEMLVFETPKNQACWEFPCALIIICYQHSYHECRHTHTHTQRGPMDARHGFLQKEASFFGPVAFNVGATRRDIQGNIHSVWTMIAHVAMEFRRIFLALVWHGSLQCGSVRGYKGRAR